MAKIIRPTYKIEETTLGFADLSKYKPDSNRRKVRPSVVQSIYNQLKVGKHFEAPLSVNRINGNDEMFDGHHRMDAVKRYLADNRSDKIKVTFHVYTELTEEEVKEEYTLVNKGTKQNTNDVVQQYQDDITILGMMRNGWTENGRTQKFACSITAYPSATSMSFFRLVGAYLAAKDRAWSGGYMESAFQFVDDAIDMTVTDLKLMNAFMHDFLAAFGPLKKNPFARSTPFTALFKIWMDNRDKMTPAIMVQRWKKLKGDHQALEIGKSGGAGATIVCRDMYKLLMNANRKRYLFV